MTTRSSGIARLGGGLGVVTLIVGLGCLGQGTGRFGGLTNEALQSFSAPAVDGYRMFEHKCSRCHTLSRPLAASIYDVEHWRVYVARMRRQSGSGISESDAEKILEFLGPYADMKRRLQAEDKEANDAPTPAPTDGGVGAPARAESGVTK